MADIKELFGKRIRKFRIKNNLSQEQLAEKVDIALNNIGKIERGESFVTAPTLEKLANVLNVEIKELFNFDDQKTVSEMRKELNFDSQNDDNIHLIYSIYKMVQNI